MRAIFCTKNVFKVFLYFILASRNGAALAFRSSGFRRLANRYTRTLLLAERQSWNPFRFIAQSSKFIPLPFSERTKRTVQPGDVLWEPSISSNSFKFGPLDDVVMGGVSSSSFDDATGIWDGTVTDANNGGFIGIRSYPYTSWNMSSCRGLQIKCKSPFDSRIKVGLRDTKDFNGVVWNASINVNNAQAVQVPFLSLIPNKFANRIVSDIEFDQSNVVGIQFVYSKFEYDGDLNPKFRVGGFRLQILEVKAF
jgi:Complex I intermediate-associated protein 30 (CIA30)